RAQQIRLAVAVEVGDADGTRLRHLRVDHALDPFPVAVQLARVLEPGELVAHPAGSGHVEFAVAVEVGECHVVGPWEALGDQMSLPARFVARLAAVVEPADPAVLVLDDAHARPPVAVEIAHGVPLDPPRLALLDEVAREAALAVAG